jgi:hypothetical protein
MDWTRILYESLYLTPRGLYLLMVLINSIQGRFLQLKQEIYFCFLINECNATNAWSDMNALYKILRIGHRAPLQRKNNCIFQSFRHSRSYCANTGFIPAHEWLGNSTKGIYTNRTPNTDFSWLRKLDNFIGISLENKNSTQHNQTHLISTPCQTACILKIIIYFFAVVLTNSFFWQIVLRLCCTGC